MVIPGSLSTLQVPVLSGWFLFFVDKFGNMIFFFSSSSGKVFLFMDKTLIIKLDGDSFLSPVNYLCCHLHQIN